MKCNRLNPYFSANGELDFTCKSLSDTDCSLVAETLKRVRTIRTLNLADCLLPFDCLKYFLDVVNELENLSLLNLKGNQIGNSITLYLSKIILMNHSITEYVIYKICHLHNIHTIDRF